MNKDEVYNRIKKKFEDGTFTSGENCKIPHYIKDGHISSVPVEQRSAGLCIGLMSYGRCSLSDVPEKERTREFYLGAFSGTSLGSNEIGNYIRNNIKNFDKQFFKDLIVTNKYATRFEGNCFEVMPIEYINEEMCSLAILNSIDWSNDDWFMSVYRRKPEALTADLWKLGARLYSRMSGKKNKFLDITPEEYRDTEYYKEMCSCNYNCGIELDTNKGQIMDTIPQEVLTPEFLVDLLVSNVSNVARFSELALETEISHTVDEEIVVEKIWQLVVKLDGFQIKNIKLNDERIAFFLNQYDKDSSEYRFGFKNNYKRYAKQRDNAEAVARTDATTKNNNMMLATVILGSAMEGNPDAVDEKLNLPTSFLLPIKYQGFVPQEFCKEYDTDEYLAMMYRTAGIQIGEEYDDLFYRVRLPEGWTIDNGRYWNNVKDKDGNTVVEYFYDSKFYDRDAYVETITIPKEKTSEDAKKVLVKNDGKKH